MHGGAPCVCCVCCVCICLTVVFVFVCIFLIVVFVFVFEHLLQARGEPTCLSCMEELPREITSLLETPNCQLLSYNCHRCQLSSLPITIIAKKARTILRPFFLSSLASQLSAGLQMGTGPYLGL